VANAKTKLYWDGKKKKRAAAAQAAAGGDGGGEQGGGGGGDGSGGVFVMVEGKCEFLSGKGVVLKRELWEDK
jgi:hypothetical protein